MDSNMDPNALDMSTGVFTAPQAGVYLITFSLAAIRDTDKSESLVGVMVLKDGTEMQETAYQAGTGTGRTPVHRGPQKTTTKAPSTIDPMTSTTGGRAVYQKLEAGDTLTLQTGIVGYMGYIMFCVQFINN